MRLLVAEDQSMLRDALCQLLELQKGVEQVLSASHGIEAQTLLQTHKVDVAILDIEMPKMTGLDVLEWVKKNCPTVKVIIMTTFRRPGYFERAVRSDVDAFVLKERSVSDLMRTIETVLNGQKEYSPELMESFVTQKNPLSSQEKLLLQAIEQGLSNKEIADKLHLSNGTVRNYISTIFTKLNVTNRTQAVHEAVKNNWL